MPELIDAPTLKSWINDGEELALFDVREAGQFGEDHMLHAIPCPYSIIETRAPLLAPRTTVRIALIDAADGTAQKAARRLDGMDTAIFLFWMAATQPGRAPVTKSSRVSTCHRKHSVKWWSMPRIRHVLLRKN